MKYAFALLFVVPCVVNAQSVELQSVDIIYGDRVIHSQHQVVLSTDADITVIPAENAQNTLGPNLVISADGKTLPYLEQSQIAAREQAIFDEVNKRTDESPFTVLFTGTIPDEIQEKRLRMMPDIGVFADEVKGINKEPDLKPTVEEVMPDVGEFSAIDSSAVNAKSTQADDIEPPASKEDQLEALIGG
ncbi:hypothetical protein [Marinomonas algarum]|uniref:Uncharacterized protein n=1 Tax=Marinomonas algarum TaxID=2883105 RepID=A0A9X1LBB8_9GAMM|nr:hypothetical protein [Marinomonas algarum]MCB5160664.1 hypothetical protein [Marinomonas algarum]